MSSTLDANVLVYASNEADPAHAACRALVERLGAGPDIVYLFWPVLLGYLRIVTHPAILPRPLSPGQAERNVGQLLSRPHVRTPAEADGFWEMYRRTRQDPTRGNDVPDAHVASLMRQHGVPVIYTRDRGFRRFDGIEVRDPTSPEANPTRG